MRHAGHFLPIVRRHRRDPLHCLPWQRHIALAATHVRASFLRVRRLRAGPVPNLALQPHLDLFAVVIERLTHLLCMCGRAPAVRDLRSHPFLRNFRQIQRHRLLTRIARSERGALRKRLLVPNAVRRIRSRPVDRCPLQRRIHIAVPVALPRAAHRLRGRP